METIEVARKKSMRRILGIALVVILIVVGAVLANNFLNNKPLQIFEDNSVEGKAKKAGYDISWIGDKNDKTGRTMLAKGRRSEELLEDKFLWTMEIDEVHKLQAPILGIGIFDHWESVIDSDDKYIVLTNPLSKFSIKARIVFEEQEASSKAGFFKATQLVLENLDYGYKNQKASYSFSIGKFSDGNLNLDKILKKGDVVSAYTIFLDEETRKTKKQMIIFDDQKIPVIGVLMIRRFGGIEQLNKEINK